MSDQNPSTPVPPQPQQSFGAVPGGQESAGQAPAAPAPAEEAPKKKSGVGRFLIWIVVVAVIAGVGWYLSRDNAVNAKVGDCLGGTTAAELDADNLKIVECTAADAGFKVVQAVPDKLFAEAEAACTEPSTEFYFWSGKEGQKGNVLCLATNAK